MGQLANVAVLLFNVVLVFATLPAFLLAKFAVLSAKVKPLHAGSCRRRSVLVSTCIGWRCALCLCGCWVRRKVEGLSAFRRELGRSGRPPVLVANHSSFMDTIWLVTLMPMSKIAKMKMFVSVHLLNMPFLGTINRAMGHLAVPFKESSNAADKKMEVDKEVMAQRMQELEDHLRAGGAAGWYPEGTMNRIDPLDVQTFRAGGFTLAAHLDVEIWCVAFQGNSLCWPPSAPVGGRPALLSAKITRLCDSSHAFVASSGIDPGDERAACICLSNSAHDRVQEDVTQLVTDIRRAPPTKAVPAGSQPLLSES